MKQGQSVIHRYRLEERGRCPFLVVKDEIKVTGEFNVTRAFELIAEIIGEREGVEVKVKSVKKKEGTIEETG